MNKKNIKNIQKNKNKKLLKWPKQASKHFLAIKKVK